jgi:hypothetical protein
VNAKAPDDVERIGRFEWERAVLRIAMPTTTKLVALALAVYANRDGSNAHPGEARLARELSLSERAIRKHLANLRDDLRLIVRESRGGSRGGYADTYRLGIPNDLDQSLLIPDPSLHRNPGSGEKTPETSELRNDGAGEGASESTQLRNDGAELRNAGDGSPAPWDLNSGTHVPPTSTTKLHTNTTSPSGASSAAAARCARGVIVAVDGSCCSEHVEAVA